MASDLADKCMAMAEQTSRPESRIITSWGFPAAELEAAKNYVEEQAQQLADTQSSNHASVAIASYRQSVNALLSFIQGSNEYRILVLSVRSDDHCSFSAPDISFMTLLVNILKLSLGKSKNLHSDSADQYKILDAKQQWEFSVDNMQELMCLLDESGTVVRANKTLERWRLGNVRSVKGSSVHGMLHPGCKEASCSLNIAWGELWGRSGQSQFEIHELYDPVLDSNIRLSIRRGEEGGQGEGFVMLVIENVSENKWEERLLEDYTEELYRQIQDQSLQILRVNTALQDEVRDHHSDKESLCESQAKLHTLSAKLLTAYEEERKRIAGELHDGIGQSISAIKFSMENMLATAGGSDPGTNAPSIRTMIGRLQNAVEEVRRISMGLRPSMLDDLGLLPTLRWFCREFQLTFNNITLKEVFEIEEQAVSSVQKLMIFRIIQEALNNATKYSQADTVWVELTIEKDQLTLLVEDNGIGFSLDQEQVARGFGLGSMKERATLSGGALSVSSTIGKGTTIRGAWPHT